MDKSQTRSGKSHILDLSLDSPRTQTFSDHGQATTANMPWIVRSLPEDRQ
jgi:hypothetical protein